MKKINHVAFDIIKNAKYAYSDNEKINRANKENSFPFKVKDVRNEIKNIISLQAKRQDYKKVNTTRENIWMPYKPLLYNIAKALPNMGYSMGQYNKVYIAKTNICKFWDDAKEYPARTKYKAIHGDLTFKISAKELRQCKIIGGLITILKRKIEGNLFECEWVSSKGQKQYFEIIKIKGYLYKDYHFIADNIKEAKEIVRLRRIQLAIDEKKRKAEIEINKLAEQMRLNRVFVELTDSLNAGNCLAGTQNFAQKHNIDLSIVGAVRADYLYKNRNGSEVFVLKAINQAKHRYAKMKMLSI